MNIKITNLKKTYGSLTVFENLNLIIPEKTVSCISGNSGCGKTTLLRLISGIEKPDFGSIDGVPGKIAYMFQEPRLFPTLTASDNIAVVLPEQKKTAKEVAFDMLNLLGLKGFENSLPSELSGGMNQRVSLARALCVMKYTDCELLLLDEPFKGLDPERKKSSATLISQITLGKTVIAVSHEPEEMNAISGFVNQIIM